MADEIVYKAQEHRLARRTLSPAGWLIAAGGGLLVMSLLGVSFLHLFWPLVFLVPGALMLVPAWRSTPERQSQLSLLAVPGAFLAIFGAITFVVNLTHHWHAWSYLWPLLPAGLVAGLMYAWRFDEKSGVHRFGWKVLRAAVVLTLALGLVFELLFFRVLGPWWPVVLIGLGVFLFVKQNVGK